MRDFYGYLERQAERRRRMHDPEVADNMDVRMDLIRRMEAGELTLEDVQARLKKIKREDKKSGGKLLYGR